MTISVQEIEQLVLPILKEEELILCETRVSGNPGRPFIQLFIDREKESVTINDCVGITRTVRDLLTLQDYLIGDFRLEVSSPGIDFPLRELWQFRKNSGRLIHLDRNDKILDGRIVNITNGG